MCRSQTPPPSRNLPGDSGDPAGEGSGECKMKSSRAGLISAVIYTGLSLVISLVFLAATLRGNYTWVARIGGAAWVFLLFMIVLMPLIIPWVKRRVGEKS